MFNPVPKPKHPRRNPKRANRTAFSKITYESIIERDKGLCIRCSRVGAHVHHINYRSELTDDVSSKRNGCVLCVGCHDQAHQSKEVREWLRWWKRSYLDDDGDLIDLPFMDME